MILRNRNDSSGRKPAEVGRRVEEFREAGATDLLFAPTPRKPLRAAVETIRQEPEMLPQVGRGGRNNGGIREGPHIVTPSPVGQDTHAMRSGGKSH